MRKTHLFASWVLVVSVATAASAQQYTVEVVEEKPPGDELSQQIVDQLAPTALRIKKGENRTLCEIWLRKAWPVAADFSPTAELLYPLKVGELLGVVRYLSKGGDFRDQEIARGVYTIRYAQQPQDGNHIGTSDTRDFLLLLRAEDDTESDPLDEQEMIDQSMEAANTAHPAMLSLLEAGDDNDQALPAMHHDQDRNFWSVRLSNQSTAGDNNAELTLEFVVVGHTDL
jgi:hypothetical protein